MFSVFRYSKLSKILFLFAYACLFSCFTFNLLLCRSTPRKQHFEEKQSWVKGKGRAQIYQGDASLAKDRALIMAKKDAVQRKLGQLIKSKTVTESGVWVKGELTAQSKGLVRNYEIQSDHSFPDYYEITILADVSQSGLVDKVQDLLDDWEKPVIFGVISETFANKKNDFYYNQTLQAFESFFLNKGFILNKISSMQTLLSPPVSTSKIVKAIEAKRIEPDFDLLLFGESRCTNAGKINYGGVTSEMVSAQLTISVSIFDIHTKRLIATTSQNSAYPHISFESGCSEGITKKLIPALAPKLFKSMLEKWGKEYGNGKSIFLEIEGNLPYDKLYKFEVILKNELRGVVDIIERKITLSKKSLEIIFKGKVNAFMEEMLNKETNLTLKLKEKKGRKLIYLFQ